MNEEKTMSETKNPVKPEVGNALWREVVIGPLLAAQAYIKALGPRKLTPEQFKRKQKNRAKRRAQRR